MSNGEIFYCTTCGKKHEAGDICFNLLEILDWDLRGVSVDFVPFGPEDVERLARENNTTLREGQLTELKLRLDVFMKLLSQIDEYAKKDFDYARMNIEDFLEGKNWPFRIKNKTTDQEDSEDNKYIRLANFLKVEFRDGGGNTLENNYEKFLEKKKKLEEDVAEAQAEKMDEISRLEEEQKKIEKTLQEEQRKYDDKTKEQNELARHIFEKERNQDAFDEVELNNSRNKLQKIIQECQNLESYVKATKAELDKIEKTINEKKQWLKKDVDIQKDKDFELNLTQYIVEFAIQPEYIEGTDILYTINFLNNGEKISKIRRSVYMNRNIRGYCTACYQPIIEGAGKYPHYLIGFLGKQEAGKTTLFVSMIEEVMGIGKIKIFENQIGIREAELLVDGQYEFLYKARRLYQKGWSILKTDKNAETGFNASINLTLSDWQHILLTFVDIAGESFYDQESHNMDIESAYEDHPLIPSCHLYAFCTCMETEGAMGILAEDLRIIMNNIYEQRKRNEKKDMAPLCLIIGKCDLFNKNEETRNTPSYEAANNFRELCNEIKERLKVDGPDNENKEIFNLYDDLQITVNLMKNNTDLAAEKVFTDCYDTYHKFEKRMYMSIISCAALGRKGNQYPKEQTNYTNTENNNIVCVGSLRGQRQEEWKLKMKEADDFLVNKENNKPVKFMPKRITHVWDWILKSLGITEAVDGYRFKYTPTLGESYRFSEETIEEDNGNRTVYEYEDIDNRINTVRNMYLNLSDHDNDLWNLKMYYEDKLENCESGLNTSQLILNKVINRAEKIRSEYRKDKEDCIKNYRNIQKR